MITNSKFLVGVGTGIVICYVYHHFVGLPSKNTAGR